MSRESAVSAIERGDLSELQHVLEESEWDIGSEPLNSKGQTALHIACANGHLDIVQYLVNKKGCSVTVEDVFGHTPLMLTFVNKHWKVANFLLYIAPNSAINELEGVVAIYNKSIVMKIAKEALVASCKEGYFELVKYIIESGWHTVGHEETQLARHCDNLHIVKFLLTHCQTSCTMPDDMSEVHIACIQGDIENVKIALDSNGPSILGTVDRYSKTPIHYSTLEPNLLRMIVQKAEGMLLNITDSRGNTPLHHSIKYECIESVTILVEAPGCDVNIANLKGETPLIAACKYSNSDIVQVLVENERCDTNSSDSEGQTALHIACANGHLDIVQYLVNKKGCSVTLEDEYGHTPLILSLINKHWKMANFLLQCALNSGNKLEEIFPITYNNSTVMKAAKEALVMSCKNGYIVLVKYLTDRIPHSKETLQIARSSSNLHIVRYLLKHYQCDIPDDISDVDLACIMGDMDTVKTAIETDGASILGIANCYGTTPIHSATLEPNVLRTIVQYAGEKLLNITDSMGNTPLHHSIKYECIESVTILVEAPGCDVNIANLKGETPLIAACKQSSSTMVQLLVASEMCDLNTADSEGNTALHIAVIRISLENVQCLLESDRCDTNVINKSGCTPLHIACHHGVFPFLEALVADKRCDLNIQDGNGDTALHIGVENVEVVKCLLESGRSRCDIYNEEGLTPFHKAIANGVMASVEVMLKNRVNILQTTSDEFQNAPIHIACKHSRLYILKVLLGYKNCDPNQQNAEGNTGLHIVCRMRTGRELKFLEVLTSTPGINPTLVNHEGDAPIHTACTNSSLQSLVSLLTCESCDPNQQNTMGDTALHIVCKMRTGNALQILEWLMSTHGINYTLVNVEGIAPCDVVGNDGNTLLHIACAEGTSTMVEFLVKNRADILKPDRHGDAPIHIACEYSRLDILNVLLSCTNCNPNQQNAKGDTALHIACRMRSDSTLQFLEVLISRCDPNICDSEGNTALHIAVSRHSSGQLENVQCLLQSDRCDPNVINKSGHTPLHIACFRHDFSLLEALVADKRCDLNIQDGNGDTALHIRVENVEVVKCLLESGHSRCDIYNEEGLTPFHKAIANGIMTSVEIMLKNGVNILQTTNDKFQNAPIHIACICSRLAILKVLLGHTKCDPNQQNSKGDTALHIVCRMRIGSELQMLEELTSTPGINPTSVNHEGDAPIHIACMHSRLDILKQLLTFKSCDPNQQNVRGDTALHIACRLRTGREPELLKMLTSTPGINPTLVNHEEDAPIHTACMNSRLESLKVLLSCESCDPNQQNTRGDTALHIVCRMRTGDELQFFELLTSTPGINPTLMNIEGIAPCDVVGDDGSTLLHIACAEGNSRMVEVLVKKVTDISKSNRHGDAPIHMACKCSRLDILNILLSCTNCNPNQQNTKGDTALNIACRMRTGSELEFLKMHGYTTMVELLVKNGADVLEPDKHGDAPIHIACKYFNLETLKILISSSCDPNQQNADGDTALHIVCRAKLNDQNKQQYIQELISTPGIDPEIINHAGFTPVELPETNYPVIKIINSLLEHKKSSIQAYLKIFVVGNSGTGKSTLIKAVTTEASQLLKYTPLSKMKYVNPSDIPSLTAGIVPIPFNSKHFGNAVLYDFAGQHEYYSSHAAVMENLILPSPPLFLLLIDISKSKEVIREELVYWWHFINNQSQKAAAPPHVILAGSHKDRVKSRDREERKAFIRDCIKRIPIIFKFVGYFSLDCRKLVSQGLSALLTQLNTTCQVLRQIVDVNLHCHIFNALLSTPELQDLVYCKLVDIMKKIAYHDAPLPKSFSQFIPLLKSLNDQGHILLLQNHTDESKSWVILKPDVLLTEVNGSVFAPKYFKQHFEFAMSTGVVTLSKLKEKFTKYNHEVIVEYLTHLEFCFRIKDQHTLDMITNNEVHKSASTEDYYFFPSLVRVENPTNVCQPHKSIAYECGWLYKCSKETEQLTTRFLHVLILRLAFACEPPDNHTETESVVLLRSCSVWKHGIAWWTNDGIEVIVEVGLQCRWVAVMMRCPATERVQCAELRSKVISTVLKTKTDFCPAITMKEYLIAPSSLKYPFEGRELILYSMSEVAKVTIDGKKYAKDTKGDNLISLPQLLPFEPYHNMGDLIWKFFSGDTSAVVTSEELKQLAGECHDKLAELKTAFKPDVGSFQRECEKAECTEVERCVALFHILQRRGRFKTWRDFQQEFSRFSVFCEQNPLVRITRNHHFSTYFER